MHRVRSEVPLGIGDGRRRLTTRCRRSFAVCGGTRYPGGEAVGGAGGPTSWARFVCRGLIVHICFDGDGLKVKLVVSPGRRRLWHVACHFLRIMRPNRLRTVSNEDQLVLRSVDAASVPWRRKCLRRRSAPSQRNRGTRHFRRKLSFLLTQVKISPFLRSCYFPIFMLNPGTTCPRVKWDFEPSQQSTIHAAWTPTSSIAVASPLHLGAHQSGRPFELCLPVSLGRTSLRAGDTRFHCSMNCVTPA